MDYNHLKIHDAGQSPMDLFVKEFKANNPNVDVIFFHLVHDEYGINHLESIKVVIIMKNGDRIDHIFYMSEIIMLDPHEVITKKIIQLVQEYNESGVKNES